MPFNFFAKEYGFVLILSRMPEILNCEFLLSFRKEFAASSVNLILYIINLVLLLVFQKKLFFLRLPVFLIL